jgi:hypothetical protein
LDVYRPAVILGNSNTPGVLGYVMPLLHWAMPSRYHSIHKNDLARAMVAQSEQAFLAIAQGNATQGGDREDPGVQGDGALLRQGRERCAMSCPGADVDGESDSERCSSLPWFLDWSTLS